MKYLALLFSFTLAFRFYGHIQENIRGLPKQRLPKQPEIHKIISKKVFLTGTESVRVCGTVNHYTLRLIQSTDLMLILVLSEYKPSEYGVQEFSVTTSSGDREIFLPFPDEPFGPLMEQYKWLTIMPDLMQGNEIHISLCVSVELALSDGQAQLHLDIGQILPAPALF